MSTSNAKSKTATPRRRFVVVLEPTPDASPSPERALARFLKGALRGYGMRCVELRDDTPCAACGRVAPLVDGECPDCRH